MDGFPFAVTDWEQIQAIEHPGQRGTARWRTRSFGELRVRMVEYTAGYLADHWCTKGHILLVLEGELVTELDSGPVFTLHAGMSYQVADDHEGHRSSAPHGATLFIVD
ncbi:MAG: DHCW motif cupin fold protein [Dermatophilaceae bacterium]